MRMSLMIGLLVFAPMFLAQPALADFSTVPPPPGVLPSDEAGLRALDDRHRFILRRAQRSCGAAYWQAPSGRGAAASARACILSMTESTVATSNDPALKVYHRALPYAVRFDPFRPDGVWRVFVIAAPR